MLRRIQIIALFFFSVFGFSQKAELKFISAIAVEADLYFGKDALGYDYFAKNNVLYKQKNSEKWEYKNLSLGKITSVDLINPLKILVFYRDFNSVILLDNQLSEISKINFSDFEIVAQTCSMASRNRFWVYDNLTSSLYLLDFLNKKKNTINQPFKSDFTYWKSDYNYWFRITSKNELYSYDNYGNVIFQGNIPKFDKIVMGENREIFLSLNDNLYFYQSLKGEIKELSLSEGVFDSFDFKNEILSIFTQNKIQNYQIILP